MTAGHRPRFVLWLSGRPPIAVCDCHYGTPVLLDRQLPAPRAARTGRAA